MKTKPNAMKGLELIYFCPFHRIFWYGPAGHKTLYKHPNAELGQVFIDEKHAQESLLEHLAVLKRPWCHGSVEQVLKATIRTFKTPEHLVMAYSMYTDFLIHTGYVAIQPKKELAFKVDEYMIEGETEHHTGYANDRWEPGELEDLMRAHEAIWEDVPMQAEWMG